MDAFPTPPILPDAPIPAAALMQALSSPGLAPVASSAWWVDGSCFLAVDLQETEGIPYVTAGTVLESTDGGATWRSLGSLEGAFTGRFLTPGGVSWMWSTWEVEGTFSMLVRLENGALVASPSLDTAVRDQGGCCFTRIERAAFADARRGMVQVSGLGAGELDPAGADVGWFATLDGGQSWVWLGEEPGRAWRRLARQVSRDREAPKGCGIELLR